MDGPNYQLKFTVADVARILNVSVEQIEDWVEIFSDQVGSRSHKGDTTILRPNDICALAYISTYWDIEPDIDSIRLSIAAEEHLGFPFYELAQEITPIFIEFPEDIEDREVESSALLTDHSEFELARSYIIAGNYLVEKSIADELADEVLFPIIYCYRHATELFIKSVLRLSESDKKLLGHNLLRASHKLAHLLREKRGQELPLWFKNIVLVFHEFDQKGETFRYGGQSVKEETFVDLNHLQTQMSMMQNLLTKLHGL